MTREWDALTYDRLASPMTRWGEAVVGWLELEGDERVMDAGCGTGRVTERLVERLPHGHVVAVDGSSAMVEHARTRLSPFGDRVEYLVADLSRPIPVDPPVDAILSTATFHWVPDHDALFASLAAALAPGGRLSAQCGGAGNVAAVHQAALDAAADAGLEAHFAGWPRPWNFATPEQTEARLRAAGFDDVRCWLQIWPVEPDEPRAFLETLCLGPHLERLPQDDHERFVDAVMARLGERPTLDYVRLNIVATRGTPDV